MRIDLHIETETDEDLVVFAKIAEVLGSLNDKPKQGGVIRTADKLDDSWASNITPVEPEPKEKIVVNGDNPAVAITDEVKGEFQASQAEQLVAEIAKNYTPIATAAVKDGERVSVNDEVVDANGEIAVVAGLFRGRAVVEYEDDSAAEVAPTTLTKRVTEQQEATVSGVIAREELLVTEPEKEVTLEEIRDLTAKVMSTVGSAKAAEIIAEKGGATRIGTIPKTQYTAVKIALEAALEAVLAA